MLRILITLAGCLLLLACEEQQVGGPPPFPAESPTCLEDAIEGEFVVRWKSGKTTIERGQSAEDFRQTFVEDFKYFIDHVEQNKRLYVDPIEPLTENTIASLNPTFSNWHAFQTYADKAWSKGITGSDDVIVAVVDTGVDYMHPQLQQRIAQNLGELGLDEEGNPKAQNGIDDDNNGYIDDAYGYDFGYDSGDPTDKHYHGTHVAGIIAAEHLDTEAGPTQGYIQGIAPNTTILPIAFLRGPNAGTIGSAIAALEYAKKRGADIINASWGGPSCSVTLGKAIEDLTAQGILFVAAAGNSGNNISELPEYPAAYSIEGLITVGATAENGFMAGFSNYSPTRVHLFAPGAEIESTVPLREGSYRSLSGTSMAAPVVSGALALLKSHRPQASNLQLKEALLAGVDKSAEYPNITNGRLNIEKAIQHLEEITASVSALR